MKQIPLNNSPIKLYTLLRRPLLAAVIVGALLPLFAWGQIELEKGFVVPPFVMDETVVGKEGWELTNPPGSPIYTDPNEALVIGSPLHDSGQETTLSLKTALKNVKIANPGDLFRVEAQFAVAYNHKYQLGGGVYFQFSRVGSMGPFDFGFAYGKEGEPGGLYYQGNGGRVLVLPQEQMAENVPYRFVIDVDMTSGTFKVSVTGKDIGEEAFRYQSGEVEFQPEFRPFKGETISLFIGNDRPTLVDVYIDYVKIIRQ